MKELEENKLKESKSIDAKIESLLKKYGFKFWKGDPKGGSPNEDTIYDKTTEDGEWTIEYDLPLVRREDSQGIYWDSARTASYHIYFYPREDKIDTFISLFNKKYKSKFKKKDLSVEQGFDLGYGLFNNEKEFLMKLEQELKKTENRVKDVFENITTSSITGMGAVTLPTATQTGSGDVPANSGDAEEEYEKKKKNKKMKKLQNFESFTRKDNVTEAFSRMSSDVIEDELYKASQELSKYYDWLKAGNDSGKGKTLDSIIDLLKKCKSNIKRFNKPEEVKGTVYESYDYDEIDNMSEAKDPKVLEIKHIKFDIELCKKSKSASLRSQFNDIIRSGQGALKTLDESLVTEAKFVKEFNKEVLDAKTKEEVTKLYPNAKFYVGKSDHFFGDLEDNLFFKAYYTKAQKEFEIKSVYSEKGSKYVHLYNESIVNEAATKSAGLVQFAADEKAEGKNAEIHLATFDGSGMEAQSTNKTWDDGVPVTKNFTRGGYKRISPKGEVYIIESDLWWYFTYKAVWYAVKRKDYGTPPFEY
tara:strand:- start:9114 stop:10703 length:1590 start_codon:yes stop_codon:yes gene_type:complete